MDVTRYYAIDAHNHGYPSTFRCSDCFDAEQFPGAQIDMIEHSEEVRPEYAGTFCDSCSKALAEPDTKASSIFNLIGKATFTRKGPKGIFHSGAIGWWRWNKSLVPAMGGTATGLEQIPGERALVFIDRNTGAVYTQEGGRPLNV